MVESPYSLEYVSENLPWQEKDGVNTIIYTLQETPYGIFIRPLQKYPVLIPISGPRLPPCLSDKRLAAHMFTR